MTGMDAPANERTFSGTDLRELVDDAFEDGFNQGRANQFTRDCLVFFAGFGTAFFFAAF